MANKFLNNINLTAGLEADGSAGTSGQILKTTGSGVEWVNASTIIGGPYLPLAGGTLTGNTNLTGSTKKLILKSGAQLGFEDSAPTGTIYLHNDGASTSRLNIGGTMWVEETGNVGIGTTNPEAKLSVSDGGQAVFEILPFTNDYGTTLRSYDTVDEAFNYLSYKASFHSFHIGNAEKVVIDGSGNVGIGTNDPGEKLEVNGNILSTGTVTGNNLSGTNTGDQDLSGYLTTSGKAADSNLLDGLDLGGTRANVANKVVRTNSSGYLDTGWINTTSGNTTNTITDIYVNTNDGYIRKATAAEFRSQITDPYYSNSAGDITEVTAGAGLTGGGASGNVTLNTGQGDGISVASDTVSVDSTVVRTSGNQTLGGTKIFSSIPTVGTALNSINNTTAASTAFVKNQGYSTADYEEGVWASPELWYAASGSDKYSLGSSDVGGKLDIWTNACKYTKNGKVVTLHLDLRFSFTATAKAALNAKGTLNLRMGSAPFTVAYRNTVGGTWNTSTNYGFNASALPNRIVSNTVGGAYHFEPIFSFITFKSSGFYYPQRMTVGDWDGGTGLENWAYIYGSISYYTND